MPFRRRPSLPGRSSLAPATLENDVTDALLYLRTAFALLASLALSSELNAQQVCGDRSLRGEIFVRQQCELPLRGLGTFINAEQTRSLIAEQASALQRVDTRLSTATAAPWPGRTVLASKWASLRDDVVAALRQVPSEVLTAEVVTALRVQITAELRPVIEEEVRRQFWERMHSDLISALRAQVAAELRPAIEAELRREFRQAGQPASSAPGVTTHRHPAQAEPQL